jgi:hypothetical protein
MLVARGPPAARHNLGWRPGLRSAGGVFRKRFCGAGKSQKKSGFFITRTPTAPCARMYIIHFPRFNIHQRPLLRALRAWNEEFPTTLPAYGLFPRKSSQ